MPNVVPRLRDYVGLTCQHDGNPNGVAATFAHLSIIIWSFAFAHMSSNGATGRNPVGVDISFVTSTQGRRCAPTLGSVSERRWRSLEFGLGLASCGIAALRIGERQRRPSYQPSPAGWVTGRARPKR